MNPHLGIAHATTPSATAARALRYGALGLPLAFAALPLYVQWPAHAAHFWGLPLAGLGLLLLAVRLLDAVVDPWIGQRVDRWFGPSPQRAWLAAGLAMCVLVAGLAGLFLLRPIEASAWPLAVFALVLTSLGFSVAQLVHQAWGARLGGDASSQARWVGAREGLGLVGVIAASVLPGLIGWLATIWVLAAAAALAWPWLRSVRPMAAAPRTAVIPDAASMQRAGGEGPWRDAGFRVLIGVHLVGGLASAIPATLVLFFMRDVLAAPTWAEGAMLGLYFMAAAAAMPLWARAVDRWGLVHCWAAGMAMAIAGFAGAASLGPGDLAQFAAVCVLTGLALGSDLVSGPALLGLLARGSTSGDAGVGRWFGWWNLAGKLTLALAAGLALPLVQLAGYEPGSMSAPSLQALALLYAWLPCAIKACALGLLWRLRHRLQQDEAARAATRAAHPTAQEAMT